MMPPEDATGSPGTIADVSRKIRRGDLSCEDVVAGALKEIQGARHFNSFASVRAEHALSEARVLDRELKDGKCRGRLHGVPVAIKDNVFLANEIASCGMPIFEGALRKETAPVVAALQAAGAVVVGKAALTEAATFFHSEAYPVPENPWGRDIWPGASSSGSAVTVASGLVYGSLGTDTGGSVRHPAACNGVFGVKPTRALLSNAGVFPHAPSFDHVGFFSRTADDARILFDALTASHPPKDRGARADGDDALPDDMAGLTVAVDWSYIGDDVDPATQAAIDSALGVFRALGAVVANPVFPFDGDVLHQAIQHVLAETAFVHRAYFPKFRSGYGSHVAGNLDAGNAVDRQDLVRAVVAGSRYENSVNSFFRDVDVLILPVFPQGVPHWPDFRHAIENDITAWSKYTLPFNVSGSPSVTVPCGISGRGVPVAVQLIGKNRSEPLLLDVARLLERHGVARSARLPKG